MSPEKKPTKPIDVYIRVSRVGDRNRESDSFQSPKQQEMRCRAQLRADGLKVGQVFTDLDESGAKASRPAFDDMLARIESGASGGVAVHDLSRFGRSTRNVLDGIDFIEERGGVFLSCAEKFDTRDRERAVRADHVRGPPRAGARPVGGALGGLEGRRASTWASTSAAPRAGYIGRPTASSSSTPST